LLLDEPTNHLDRTARDLLSAALCASGREPTTPPAACGRRRRRGSAELTSTAGARSAKPHGAWPTSAGSSVEPRGGSATAGG
jgi:hypothetical protein